MFRLHMYHLLISATFTFPAPVSGLIQSREFHRQVYMYVIAGKYDAPGGAQRFFWPVFCEDPATH
eukprot:6077854-Amphidinium_carterae.1